MSRVIKEMVRHSDMKQADFDAYFSLLERWHLKKFQDDSFLQTVFHNTGYMYGPMRSYRAIPDMESYKKMLILRDPRDVLVSKYYSDVYSHPPLSRAFIEQRRKYLERGIDEYVLDHATVFRDRYMEYAPLLEQPNLFFYTFRDMMSEPLEFIQKLTQFVGIEFPAEKTAKIVNKDMAPVTSENVFRHKRAARSGTFKEKLRPETVDELNRLLEEPIRVFGF